MIETQRAIFEFHKKHQFPINLPIVENKGFSKILMLLLISMTSFVAKIALKYWSYKHSESFYRYHLMAEELAELMTSINNGDELKASDGLGDLLYVVIGTGVTYTLPAKEIMQEVCHSNALKAPRDPITNPRLRNKGKDWRPPDFEKALLEGRKRLLKEKKNVFSYRR